MASHVENNIMQSLHRINSLTLTVVVAVQKLLEIPLHDSQYIKAVNIYLLFIK